MANFSKKQLILQALSDGKFHSGEALGQMLGVSRAAVGKHIQQLTALGVEIFRVSGKGYCLSAELSLLNEQQIREHSVTNTADIEVKHVITSTNDHLLQRIRQRDAISAGHTVVAECQTAGRGRRGRAWVSPFGSHIYFSMYWPLDGLQRAMGLSIAVGVAIREAVQAYVKAPVKVKWPNDLLIEDRKVAGILVELEGQADGPCGVVIGVGININMPSEHSMQIDQPWADLASFSTQSLDRNLLIAALIDKMHHQLTAFEQHGLRACIEQWNQHDRYFDQPIKLILGQRTLEGIGKGIDLQGGILLQEHGNDKPKAYYGGEISLRSAK